MLKSLGRSEVNRSAMESSRETVPVTYRGLFLIRARKSPAFPVISSTVASVCTVILGFLRMRRTLISKPHAGGHIFGKYLWDRMTRPPRNASFSTRTTGYPTSAASTAAVIPAIPPPMTRMGFGSGFMAHSGEKGWDTSGRSQAYTGQPYGYRVVW